MVSRMWGTAAVGLVCSGLIVCSASAAVAAAEPEASGDGPGSGSARASAGESAGRVGLRTQTAPRTVTRHRTGGSAPRVPTPLPRFPDEEPSKLPPVGEHGAESPAEDLPGEQQPDPDDECGGWWMFPRIEGPPTSSTGGGYDGGLPGVARPPVLPDGPDLAPDDLLPESPALPAVPDVTPPMLALPPVPPGLGVGTGEGGDRDVDPDGPSVSVTPPVQVPQRPLPARAGDAAAVPASYRAGYGEYLRTASMTEVAAVAVPGATAIMLLTGMGGVIGYRQARAGHAIRAGAVPRFAS